MANEKDLVLGLDDGDDDDLEGRPDLDEIRANMAECRDTFNFLSDFGPNNTWVSTNNMQRRVARSRVLCMEVILHGIREIHDRTVPQVKPTDSGPS